MAHVSPCGSCAGISRVYAALTSAFRIEPSRWPGLTYRSLVIRSTGRRVNVDKKLKEKAKRLAKTTEWDEIKAATKHLSRDEKQVYHSDRKAALQLAPVDFTTTLRKLLHKATRGNDLAIKDEALRHFSTLVSKLERKSQCDEVMDYVSCRYGERAWADVFPRILQDTHRGLLWMLQFRARVQEYARRTSIDSQRRETDETNHRSFVVQQRQRQERLAALGNHLRYRISEYFMLLSSAVTAGQQSACDSSGGDSGGISTSPLPHSLLDCTLLNFETLSNSPDIHALRQTITNEIPYVVGYDILVDSFLRDNLFGPTKRVYGWYLQFNNDVSPRIDFDTTTMASFKSQLLPPRRMDKKPQHAKKDEGELCVILYASLQPSIPSTIQEIYDAKPSGMALPVASFYAISHTYSKFRALGIGELMTYRAIQHLHKAEGSGISTFVTLSPIFDLKQWFFRKENVNTIKSSILNLGKFDAVRELVHIWDCSPDEVYSRLKDMLTRNYKGYKSIVDSEPRVEAAISKILLRAAAYYLVEAKTPLGKPLDNVARFHIHNGASVYRINLAADLSDEGWRSSCGVMVNYRYDLAYRNKSKDPFQRFPVGESVIQWLTPAQPPEKARRVLLRKPLGSTRRRLPLGSLRERTWRRCPK